ncbi:Uncharacterised protein [Legionella pneumophila]|nr:Uncharacterised protein [Legionella pneumophila]
MKFLTIVSGLCLVTSTTFSGTMGEKYHPGLLNLDQDTGSVITHSNTSCMDQAKTFYQPPGSAALFWPPA